MTRFNLTTVHRLSIAATVIDAVVAFARGRPKQGLVLLGAAVLASRVPGIGTAVSLLSRLARRVR
jgi:hypothetical protein